ncbi:MAG: MBL fold metallo-hydrolase [Candidatus Thorarchaeota archaeon]|jgi:L-ascorbate metabolism protein UlaG (beta-lactamase superfamily)
MHIRIDMHLSKSRKIVLVIVVGAILVSTPIILMMTLGQDQPGEEIKVTLLNFAGVMIEAKGMRIYVDPCLLPSNYSDLPADVILITHPHSDHYSLSDIQDIETDDTAFIFPENMTVEIERHDGIGLDPGDAHQVGEISITAFYMYTLDRPFLPSSHPKDANWTSYIIDIDGFKIFHAGDAKYMEEYVELSESLDVAFLPIYWDGAMGPIDASLTPIAEVVETIQPKNIVPTHFNSYDNDTFITDYSSRIEDAGCVILSLAAFESFTFIFDEDVL